MLVAPRDLRRQLLDLIEHEASLGVDGHITFKCNSIADEVMAGFGRTGKWFAAYY
jgi:polyphosphate kinase